MRKILHLSTGGTITGCEIDYPAISKISTYFKDAIDIKKYLTEAVKINAEYLLLEICNKDSREINDDDREMLVKEIEKAYKDGVKHFLVTHGTFTMPETGIFLIKNLSKDTLENSSIIFTGAMYPMNLVGGDGLLNLGASISVLINTEKPLGVKINMHGKNWDPQKIIKDAENLIFKDS